MTIDNQNVKRIGIYFFYDAQGIADEYIFYFLDDICKNLNELYIVCNGTVNENDRRRMLQHTPHVIIRPNQGLDVGAYCQIMESIGYEKLAQYDELILMNSTMFGPLYSFKEMFETMAERDLDFWGITSHGRAKKNPREELPAHIQSHFIVVRKTVLQSPEFERYWRGLPEIKSYEDSVNFHEVVFTQHFEALGFHWATYTKTEELAGVSPNPIITMPRALVQHYRCPIVKRRSFFQNYCNLLHDTNGNPGREVFDYIQGHLDYPVELIWENLLRTCNHTDLRRCLQLNYILPEHFEMPTAAPVLRAALWLHIYYLDLAEECCRYAESMPAEADVLITTDTQDKKRQIEMIFSRLKNQRIMVILVENRGRDNSALLVGCAPYLNQYDVVCFAHDKKIRQLPYEIQGKTFSERCFQNTLKSAPFVKNVLRTFAENPRLGLLCPPPPNTSAYYNTIGISDWGPNYENTKALYDWLGLTVPISREIDPVAPFGSVFWFRTAALKLLFDYGWNYEDFPAEPVDFDGSLLHAIERIYPYVAQQAGYYSGWLLSSGFAAMELTNYHYMLRELNRRLIPTCGSGDFQELRNCAERLVPFSWRFFYLPLKRWFKAHLSEQHYYALQRVKKKMFREV